MIEIGSKAPDFKLPDQDGGTVGLADFRGKPVVLYFYPRDNTPGCTAEACEFRDHYSDFEELEAIILGVSTDGETSHRRFRDKYDLPFHLLSDAEHEVHELYGTWIEKKMYGKTYFGTRRATFIIGGDGVVRRVFPDVKPKGHAAEVKAALEDL